MLNMETISEYLIKNQNYFDRQNNSALLNKMNYYGLGNAILDIFVRKSITGISNIKELVALVESGQNLMTDNMILGAKRRYLKYLLDYYVSEPLEEFYDREQITDQDIDYGSSKAMDAISNYVINKNRTNVIRR